MNDWLDKSFSIGFRRLSTTSDILPVATNKPDRKSVV